MGWRNGKTMLTSTWLLLWYTPKEQEKKTSLRSIGCSRYILCCWEVSTNPSTYVQVVINCGEKNQVELTFLGYIVPKDKGHL